ncbi:hypothetical protein [Methylorubrum extorquens]|uniref:hypothetical protein n=1 Tax=Methylorubrum extorquens TaxID=408 RepID=UPI00209F8EEF|nr:hypothetical protein [Methylorubrum extorquens]MCP1540125.1 hypothetical protein [Methylorubrum extorquens]
MIDVLKWLRHFGMMPPIPKPHSKAPLSDNRKLSGAEKSRGALAYGVATPAQNSLAWEPETEMTEVPAHRFDSMAAELHARIETVLGEFAQAHDTTLDLASMAQGHCDIGELVQDAMTFGMNIWPAYEGEEVAPADNVVRFEPKPQPGPVARILKATAATVGAVVGTTLVASATTDAINFPFLGDAIELVARHNPPKLAERIVEHKGRLMRISYSHSPGKPGHHVVVKDIELIGMTDKLDMAEVNDGVEIH